MVSVGIEAMNVFGGTACLDVEQLADYRRLDMTRFHNLLMKEKAVALPYEDPVTYAVNAARPIVDALPPEAKDRIEMLITCSESGIDFGKSLSTYVHAHLGLNRNCRLFEIKQACYAGTAGFQTAVNFVLSQDVSRREGAGRRDRYLAVRHRRWWRRRVAGLVVRRAERRRGRRRAPGRREPARAEGRSGRKRLLRL